MAIQSDYQANDEVQKGKKAMKTFTKVINKVAR